MPNTKPLLIIVSGAPGSGKTTLAAKVAHRLRLPHIERDTILRGIEYTAHGSIDRSRLGIESYYSVLEYLIQTNISFVTDGTLYKGVSEQDIKRRLIKVAHVVNIHTRATQENQRFYDREMNRSGHPSDWVKGHMQHLDDIYDQTVNPLDMGITVIEVDATSEYIPSFDVIVDRINQDYNKAINESRKRYNETTN